MDQYRYLWIGWCSSTGPTRELLQAEMAALEAEFGDDPVWDPFVGTLPGFSSVLQVKLGAVLDLMERAIDQE